MAPRLIAAVVGLAAAAVNLADPPKFPKTREEVLALREDVWAEAAIDPSLREMVFRFLSPVRQMLRGLVAEWAAAHPDVAGDDSEAYAQRAVPVLMGLAPGFMVQRAILADFDEDAYLDTVRRLIPS